MVVNVCASYEVFRTVCIFILVGGREPATCQLERDRLLLPTVGAHI